MQGQNTEVSCIAMAFLKPSWPGAVRQIKIKDIQRDGDGVILGFYFLLSFYLFLIFLPC